MPPVHNALTRGRLSSALRAAIGIQKDEGGLERYGETLTPIIDLWSLPEWAIHRNEVLWSLHGAVGATAAEFSMVALTCPLAVGSQQYLIFVDEIWGAAGAVGSTVDLCLQTRTAIAATLGAAPPVARDMRTGANVLGTNVAAPEGWFGSDPVAFTNVVDRNVASVILQMVPLVSPPWILKPGAGLVLQNAVANQSMRALFKGRARVALPGELVSV